MVLCPWNIPNEVLEFAKGKGRKDFECNRMLTLAVIKELEIIGEAASKVSPAYKATCLEIPGRI